MRIAFTAIIALVASAVCTLLALLAALHEADEQRDGAVVELSHARIKLADLRNQLNAATASLNACEAPPPATAVEPLAITSAFKRVDVVVPESGALILDAHYQLTTDNAEAIAMGAQHRHVVVRFECSPRATCLNAIATLRDNSLIVNDGGWPEGAIALPRPRKP